jgi:hypothetical protein
MPSFQITELAVIVIAICATVVFLALIIKARDGLKIWLGMSGVKVEMADKEPDVTPDEQETKDEMCA